MWKFVTRGIRETLERRACRTNVYSQTSQDGNTKNEVKTNLVCNHKFLAPSFSAYNKGFCGSAKAGGTKDKDHDSKWNTKYTWSDAVGWSSVLALGWVVCQTLCLRRRIFDKEKTDALKNKIPQLPEARLSHLFGHVLNLHPKHILPITNCNGISNRKSIQEGGDAEWQGNKPFGPLTIEEALKEATDEFSDTHKIVMGEFELQYGIKALEEKRYKDAIKHFTTGAKLSSPASMFNLGLCYELGLGTLADQTKAAKYYIDAAQQGHADAIYNLGVFYAQGRGGFSIDIGRARSYFIEAAKLGQTEAQRALELEKHYRQVEEENKTFVTQKSHEMKLSQVKNDNNIRNILKKVVGYDTITNSHVDMEPSLERSDHKHAIEGKSPTEIFLEFLGISEPKLVPASIIAKNCSVPC